MAGSSAASDRSATVFGVERADWPLTLGGAGLAVTLSLGAAVLCLRGSDRPLVTGGEHFAVFAKPARLHAARGRQPEPQVAAIEAPPPVAAPPAFDFTPTATIPAAAEPAPPAPAKPVAPPSYALLRAGKDRATFLGPDGPIEARRGDVVPGLGRIQAFKQDGGDWTVVLSAPKAGR